VGYTDEDYLPYPSMEGLGPTSAKLERSPRCRGGLISRIHGRSGGSGYFG